MTISLHQIGKRYNYEWIFRKIEVTFYAGKKYAITGPNGSGKSTLLQVISGSLGYSEGEITFLSEEKKIEEDFYYKEISLVAPYLELIEEFTLREILNFQFKFKPKLENCSLREMAETVGLSKAWNKPLSDYSSGMKQRVKLALAFFSDVPVLLLDEPCSNLDGEGVDLYKSLLSTYTKDKIVIICSNDLREYEDYDEMIKIVNYK